MTSSATSSRWAVGSSTSSTGAVDEDGPGQGDAGPLPGRQAEAVVAERGRERQRQARDEALEADQAQGVPEGLVVGAVAEHEGVAQGAGRQERPLGDEVGAAGAHGTGGGRAQPGRELEEGRLADPGRAGDGGEAGAGMPGATSTSTGLAASG